MDVEWLYVGPGDLPGGDSGVILVTGGRLIMSKRLGVKLALAIAAVSAMTLLQGCGEDDVSIGLAWGPVGSVPIPAFSSGFTGATSQSTGGTPVEGGP